MHNVRRALLTAVLVTALVGSLAVAAYGEDAAYVGNKQCKICHNTKEAGEIWNSWKAEKHAKALETLSSDAAKEIATKQKLDKPPAESPQCLQCHVTGYDLAKAAAPEAIAKEDGVQCESCHGPASLHIPDGKALKTKKDAAVTVSTHINVKPDEATCKKCHNEKSPTWKGSFNFAEMWAKIVHKNPGRTQK